jgi:DNA-binding XRE family transcriptional regulator
MANESETIGHRLRARRVELGRTLAEVAEQSGLSLPYVSNLERGRGNPTLDALGQDPGLPAPRSSRAVTTSCDDHGVDGAHDVGRLHCFGPVQAGR